MKHKFLFLYVDMKNEVLKIWIQIFLIDCKKLLDIVVEEALRLGHDYIGTAAPFVRLIREGEGCCHNLLRRLGCDLQKLKKSIEE
jgi:ATP-dependent Clp protease ATP-binding subunit ClpA